MGIRSKINQWIQKRIVGAVLDDTVKKTISGFLKQEILNTINDEEVAKALMGYGDAFYDRYQSKFTGWLGGTQKGLNSVIKNVGNGEENQNDFLMNMISGLDGQEFSLSNALKLLLVSSKSKTGSNNRGKGAVMS